MLKTWPGEETKGQSPGRRLERVCKWGMEPGIWAAVPCTGTVQGARSMRGVSAQPWGGVGRSGKRVSGCRAASSLPDCCPHHSRGPDRASPGENPAQEQVQGEAAESAWPSQPGLCAAAPYSVLEKRALGNRLSWKG